LDVAHPFLTQLSKVSCIMPAGVEGIVDTTAQEARDAAAAVKEQARLASLAMAESLAKDKAAALLLAQEEVRSREEELEDADAELTRLERNIHNLPS
jgi:acyl-CoA reductase-like NAD-dependent aldehyde dehydrogenase